MTVIAQLKSILTEQYISEDGDFIIEDTGGAMQNTCVSWEKTFTYPPTYR